MIIVQTFIATLANKDIVEKLLENPASATEKAELLKSLQGYMDSVTPKDKQCLLKDTATQFRSLWFI